MNHETLIQKRVADDWGISQECNSAILNLINKKLIHRVSVMVLSDFFYFRLEELKASDVEISLHLDLTFFESIKNEKYHWWQLAFGFFRTKTVQRIALKQIRLFRKNFIGANSIESHEYIHLIPWVAKSLDPVLRKTKFQNIRFHQSIHKALATFFSYVTFYLIYSRSRGYKILLTCESADFQNSKSFIVVHPATENSNDVRDSWRQKRVLEYSNLLCKLL